MKPSLQNESKAPLISLLGSNCINRSGWNVSTLEQLELSQWLESAVGLCLFLIRNSQHLAGQWHWVGLFCFSWHNAAVCRQAPKELALEQPRAERCSFQESFPKAPLLGKKKTKKGRKPREDSSCIVSALFL